jgi:hypothetical protein
MDEPDRIGPFYGILHPFSVEAVPEWTLPYSLVAGFHISTDALAPWLLVGLSPKILCDGPHEIISRLPGLGLYFDDFNCLLSDLNGQKKVDSFFASDTIPSRRYI